MCVGTPVSNKDMVAAWFKTSCSSPLCTHSSHVVSASLFLKKKKNTQIPSTVSGAGFDHGIGFMSLVSNFGY